MRAVPLRRKLKLFDGGRVSGRLLRGIGSSFAANAMAVGVAFGSSLVLARALGSADFGIFTYVNSWLNIAVLVATLGLDAALVRFLPEYAAREDWAGLRGVLGWSRRTALFSSTVAAVILAAVGGGLFVHSGSAVGLTACIAAGSLPLLALVAVNQGALQGFHRVGFSLTPRAILRPLLLTTGVVGLWMFGTELSAPAAMALNAVALAGALWVGARWLRQVIPTAAVTAPPRLEGRHWLRVALPMLSVSGMGILLHETSVIVTAAVAGTTLAGVYAVATRLSRIVAFGMTAGNSITNPLISELYTQQDQRRLQLVSSTASAVSLSVATVLLLALAVGGRYVLAAFGDAFQAGQSVVLILAVGQICNAATGPVVGLLNMTGHQDRYARITMTISTLNLIVNVPAVMLWGIQGAAVVTTTSIAAQRAWAWFAVHRFLGIDSTPLGFLRARGMQAATENDFEGVNDPDRRLAA